MSEVPPFAAPPPVLDINETSTLEGFEVLRGTRGAWGRSRRVQRESSFLLGGTARGAQPPCTGTRVS